MATNPPQLRWHGDQPQECGGDVRFTVFWSPDSLLAHPDSADAGINAAYTFAAGALTGPTTVYWRVRARSSDGHSRWSDPATGWRFLVPAPAVAEVYPGDTDNSGKVDVRDLLPLGLYYGLTGPGRGHASVAWAGQPLYAAWNPPAAGYADCNGDGTVDASDLDAIVRNWNASEGSAAPDSSRPLPVFLEVLQALNQEPASPSWTALRAHLLETMRKTFGTDVLAYHLEPNRPNPFGSSTTWMLTLPEPAEVRIRIFDPCGRLLWRRSLTLPAGLSPVTFNGRDARGLPLPSGSYVYRIETGDRRETGRILLVR